MRPEKLRRMATDSGGDKRLGKYLLKSRLGQGGMGVVYLATDQRLKRDVALKILSKELSANADAVRRFLREARIAAQLNHPHIVAIHDVDQQRGYCFLVMELVTGGTAQDLLSHGPLSWQDASRIVADACRGLAAMHEAGMIHRDIKPSNLMRTADGVVKLADFGLAKVAQPSADANPLTRSGAILGTPQYMSPEQCQGESLDARSDIYSLGAAYYTLLTGQAPFMDSQPLQVMFAHCSKPAPDPRSVRAEIPEACAQIVLKAMAKQRAERFESARQMLSELEAALMTAPTLALRDTTRASAIHSIQQLPPSIAAAQPSVAAETLTLPLVQTPGARILKQPARVSRNIVLAGTAAAGLLAALLGVAWWRGLSPAADGTTPAVSPNRASGTAARSESSQQQIVLEPDREMPGIHSAIRSIAFSPDGKFLFAGSLNDGVRRWEIDSPQQPQIFPGTTGAIHAVATNRRWLAAGGDAKTVWLWNHGDEQPRVALADFASSINALAISPDGLRLAAGTESEARLYELDASQARLIQVLGTSTAGEVLCYMVQSVAFSPDSRWVAATTWNEKALGVWDAKTGKLHTVVKGQAGEPMAVAFLPGGNSAIFGLHNLGLHAWDLATSIVREVSPGWKAHLRSFAITPDAQAAVVVGEWDGPLHVFDLTHSGPPRVIKRPTGTSAIAVAFSPDGTRLATAGGDSPQRGYLHLWKVLPAAAP